MAWFTVAITFELHEVGDDLEGLTIQLLGKVPDDDGGLERNNLSAGRGGEFGSAAGSWRVAPGRWACWPSRADRLAGRTKIPVVGTPPRLEVLTTATKTGSALWRLAGALGQFEPCQACPRLRDPVWAAS